MAGDVTHHLTPAGRMPDVDRVTQIEVVDDRLEIVGVMVHVMTAIGLRGAAMAAAVMRDRAGRRPAGRSAPGRASFYANLTIGGGPAPARAYIEELLPDVLEGRIEPGRVLDRTVARDHVPDGYRGMAERTALKVMVTPDPEEVTGESDPARMIHGLHLNGLRYAPCVHAPALFAVARQDHYVTVNAMRMINAWRAAESLRGAPAAVAEPRR
jgi:hypothetical protein